MCQRELTIESPFITQRRLAAMFNFYMRIMGVKAQEPFSGETVVLEDGGSGHSGVTEELYQELRHL